RLKRSQGALQPYHVWVCAPQKSTTGSQQGQQGWGGAPQKSTTGSQPQQQGWGGAPQKSNTGAGEAPHSSFTDAPEYPQYEIDGIVYKMIRVISANSGEAKIFEIEHDGRHYALKLYKPHVHPNHEVLDRVMNLRGNGMLIDIYAHGVWTDKTTGIKHDYEIMGYCSGGSLATLKLTGDEKRMREITARMAATLDFAHSHGILHRDVKPANFLFTDETHTQFVLTDWGLAKILDKDGRTVTDNGRTKIYAAPEMYIYIDGKPTHVDAKADFFSMGMTLLALWMGEGLLTADEEELVKKKRYGKLSYPSSSEMSEHLLSLIKALTLVNPEERAGLDDIARWASGEIIYRDPVADDTVRDFRIVFSAQKKLIAHNAKELGVMMWENRELGKDYLYGKLEDWLKEQDQTELANEIWKIKEELYPGNQDAGLFAAALFLNPETLYEGLDGKPLATQQDIARELFDNVAAYKKALFRKREHPLWAYLSANQLGDKVEEFRKLVNKNGERGVLTIAYMLDPELPYRFEGKIGTTVLVYKFEGLAEALATNQITNIEAVLGEDFLYWAANRNPALAGKAKEIVDGGFSSLKSALRPVNKGGSEEISDELKAEFLTYVLLPDVGMDYKPIAESRRATPEQFAYLIQPDFEVKEEGNTVTVSTISAPIAPIKAYLAARGKYDRQLSWINYCFDIDSADNKKKYLKYDEQIARFKAAAGLAGEVLPLKINGVTFKTLNDVQNTSFDRWSEMAQNIVAKWVSLFFQENPKADYKKTSYFKLAGDFFEFIYVFLPGSKYANNARPKIDAIYKAGREYDRAYRKVKIVRWCATIFCLLPLLLVIMAGVYLLITQGASEIGAVMNTIGTWTGIIVGVIVALAAIGETENLIIGGIAGLICFAVVKFCLVFIAPAVPWIILAFFLIQLVLNARAVFTNNLYTVAPQYSDLSIEEGVLRAEMSEAFGCRDKLLPSNLTTDYPEVIYRQDTKTLNSAFGGFVKKMLWLFVVTIGACAFCFWIYRMDPEKIGHKDAVAGVELLDGSFSGNVKGTPLDVAFSTKDEVMSADMVIKYRSGNTVQTMKSAEGAALAFPVVMAKEGDAAITLTIDTVYMEAGSAVATGTYLNSKGNRQPVNIKKK
ncbi:MAG: protein kinase, partial [Muribaculaceae bacterium]|nr:protein kinase [Muribaculaceae bacterium]